MYKKITTQLPFEIATLSEVKAQCRLTSSFTIDDDYLSGLIEVCSALAQNYTNRLLSVGTVIASLQDYDYRITLFGGEINSVTSVTAEFEDGTIEDVIGFKFNNVSQKLTIPNDYAGYTNFLITYDTGYSVIPKPVKQGVLMMIASMYNNREDGLVGQDYQSLPFTSLRLLDTVKIYET